MQEENPIYNYLKSKKMTSLGEKEFVEKYTDRNNLKGVYDFLKENGNTQLEFNVFADKYFPIPKEKDLPKQNEVSSQGSKNTSETSTEPSQVSQPTEWSTKKEVEQGFIDPTQGSGKVTLQPDGSYLIEPVEITGTSRWDNFGLGMAGLNQGIFSIPRYVFNLFSAPQNYIAEQFDLEFLRSDYDDVIAQLNSITPLGKSMLGTLDDLVKYYKLEESAYSKKIRKYDKGIFDNLKSGNFSEAGSQVFDQIAESAGSMILMALTGSSSAGLTAVQRSTAMALPFMSQKGVELENDSTVPEYQKPLISALYGYSEVIFDQKWGTQAVIESLVKTIRDEGVEEAVKQARNLTLGYLNRAINAGYNVGKTAVKGSAEEMAVKFSQNLIDKLTINPNKDLTEGLADAGIVGGVMTGTLKSVEVVIPKNKKTVLDLEQQYESVVNELNKNPQINTQGVLLEQADKIQAEIDKVVSEDKSKISNLSTENAQKVQELTAKIEAINSSIQETKNNETVSKVLEQEKATLESELESILESPTENKNAEANQQIPPVTKNNSNQSVILDNGQKYNIDLNTNVITDENGKVWSKDGYIGKAVIHKLNSNVKTTAKALEGVKFNANFNLPLEQTQNEKQVAEAYHKAKEDGSNPKLVGAVEDILNNSNTTSTPTVNKNTVEAIFTGDVDAIRSRKSVLRDEILNSIKGKNTLNSGVNPEALIKIMEYAVLSVADGTITTAKALYEGVKEFGISEKQASTIFNEAKLSAKEYKQTNPDLQAISKRQGSVLVEAQSAMTKPDGTSSVGGKNISKKDIKNVTDKGISGKTEVSNRTLLNNQIQTLERGIKEGLKQAKGKAKETASALKDAKQKMKDFVKISFKSIGKVKVPASVGRRLLNIVRNADTPSKIDDAINLIRKVVEDIEIIKKIDAVKGLQTKVKKLSKRKGVPKELGDLFRELARINPRYLTSGETNALLNALNQANTLFKNENSMISKNQVSNLVRAEEQGKALSNLRAEARKLTDAYKKEKIKSLTKKLEDAGVSQNIIESLKKDGDLEQTMNNLAKELDEVLNTDENGDITAEPITKKSREILEDVFEALKYQIDPDNLPQELTDKQVEVVKAILNADAESFSDVDLFSVVAGLRNLQINGTVVGLGKAYANAKAFEALNDSKKVSAFKTNIRVPSAWGKSIADALATGTVRLKQIINNEINANAVFGFLGFTKYSVDFEKTYRQAEAVKNRIKAVYEAHKKDIDNEEQKVYMSVYADVAQYKSDMTPEQIKEEFEGRKEALAETIKRIKEEGEKDKTVKKKTKEYLKHLESAYEKLEKADTADDFFKELNKGQKALYTAMREEFEAIKDDMKVMADLYGNSDYDPLWENYFPRTYEKVGRSLIEDAQLNNATNTNATFSINNQVNRTKSTKSGAVKGRTLTGGNVRAGHIVSYNALGNFFNTYNTAIYDINTIEARNFVASMVRRAELLKLIPETQERPLIILENVYVEKVQKDMFSLRTGSKGNIMTQILSSVQSISAVYALGGVFQFAKQSIPVIGDTFLRLGKSNIKAMSGAISHMITDTEAVNKLLENTAVGRRSVKDVVLPKQDSFKINQKGLADGLGKLGISAVEAGRIARDISMASLTYGDAVSAKVSWLAFYIEAIEQKGGKFDVNAPVNEDALAYANLKINTIANESDSSMKSRIASNKLYSIFMPFASFAINSHVDMASNIARLRDGFTNKNSPEYGEVISNLAGNFMAVALFHGIAHSIRVASIEGYHWLAKMLRPEEEDEDLEETLKLLSENHKREKLEMNELNSWVYLINDFVFRGVASGIFETSTKPTIEDALISLGFFNEIESEKIKQARYSKPASVVNALGMYGIPLTRANETIATLEEASKEDWNTDNFRMRRFGQETSDGLGVFVPKENKNTELSKGLKTLKNLEIAMSIGNLLVPAQEVNTSVRGLRSLNKTIRDAVYGKSKDDREESLNILKSFVEISFNGEDFVLTNEQLDYALNEYDLAYKKFFPKIKREEVVKYLGDSGSEKEIANILKEIVTAKVLGKYYKNKELKTKGIGSEDEILRLEIKVKNYIKQKRSEKLKEKK